MLFYFVFRTTVVSSHFRKTEGCKVTSIIIFVSRIGLSQDGGGGNFLLDHIQVYPSWTTQCYQNYEVLKIHIFGKIEVSKSHHSAFISSSSLKADKYVPYGCQMMQKLSTTLCAQNKFNFLRRNYYPGIVTLSF